MTRAARFAVAVSLAVIPLVGLAAPASAAAGVPAPAAVSACNDGEDTSDFAFDSFDADYYLDVDEDGRSTLTTVETFVAVFPDIDQNRGMRRAIPETYDGAPLDVDVVSVTDEAGNPRPFDTESDDDGFLVVTSAGNACVHGAQTYVFTYTQHNVTRYFASTDDEEFYWDTNGTGAEQTYGTAISRVHVPAALADSLTGNNACYRGVEGSSQQCEVTVGEDADGAVISTSVSELSAYENVTVVVAFEPGTFVPRDDSYLGSFLSVLQIIGLIVAVIGAIWGIVVRRTALADGRGRPTIIAEYAPPKGLDPFIAAVILKQTKRAAAAGFISLAVNRRIRIVETETKGFFSTKTNYLLELVDATGLTGPELDLAQALFGYQLVPGTGFLMSAKDVTLSEKIRAIIGVATRAVTTMGLRKKGTGRHAVLPVLVVVLGTAATVVFGFGMIGSATGGVIPFLLIIPAVIALLIVFGSVFRLPLSESGAELRDHLEGLRLFIRVAEADRIRMLQSPQGAEREPVATDDPRQVLDVYEKLLPYAVLFNLETEWAKELGKYYVEEAPDWYSGNHAFNAAIFASSISTMSSSVASSYSGSNTSSSSGGSGGGGYSGGGGGGGGAGGV